MLFIEYEKRMGEPQSYEEFDLANEVYLMVAMDKDDFCKYWKIVRDIPLIHELIQVIRDKQKEIERLEEGINFW